MGGPSTWQRFLDERGEGVHHIAFEVNGMDDRISDLAGRGFGLEQRGDWSEGNGGCYAYMDTTSKLGMALELLENF